MDHLTALKVFRAVAANGGFAAAARQMNLSPAAVSKNVAELEAHLKVRLINRTTRSMSLTEAGEVYRQRLERILDDLEAADAALTSMQQGPSGLLRVSAPLTLALTCLTPAIPAFSPALSGPAPGTAPAGRPPGPDRRRHRPGPAW